MPWIGQGLEGLAPVGLCCIDRRRPPGPGRIEQRRHACRPRAGPAPCRRQAATADSRDARPRPPRWRSASARGQAADRRSHRRSWRTAARRSPGTRSRSASPAHAPTRGLEFGPLKRRFQARRNGPLRRQRTRAGKPRSDRHSAGALEPAELPPRCGASAAFTSPASAVAGCAVMSRVRPWRALPCRPAGDLRTRPASSTIAAVRHGSSRRLHHPACRRRGASAACGDRVMRASAFARPSAPA